MIQIRIWLNCGARHCNETGAYCGWLMKVHSHYRTAGSYWWCGLHREGLQRDGKTFVRRCQTCLNAERGISHEEKAPACLTC